MHVNINMLDDGAAHTLHARTPHAQLPALRHAVASCTLCSPTSAAQYLLRALHWRAQFRALQWKCEKAREHGAFPQTET